ncbi:hypothetical protein NUKP32_56460 [Klebsiella variicola]|uniref:hypothetical protein n=1 Tax=Klebsiella pneumoniae complex TaxID=3390273 RepID=UPI000DE77D9B|nr:MULTISPECIES: hypothetical protein [Klebsiella]UNA31704.1 hypothetical protein LOF14_00935 [Klebsiella variicola subsp. variicola]HDH1559198.1 hypothetical protein [Klebsiella quasipneumoniae subsp. similipneumoniae]EIX9118917.1 hypothetical protein [Klebsiella pneumoniae]EIY5226042.1 hypothetical protein [Klebsiella quasipneumoniae]MCQ3993256.1 hypothetical protein [Klebsiella pneumoniae]
MHQQTTQTKRFEKLLNWCQGQVREMDFILEDAYLSEEEKISSLEELLDKCLTMQAPLIVLSNKIKTTIKQLQDQ